MRQDHVHSFMTNASMLTNTYVLRLVVLDAAPVNLLPVDVRKQRPAGINQSAPIPHPALGPPPPPQHLQRQTSGLRAGPPAPAPILQGSHRQTSSIGGNPASLPGMQDLSLNQHQSNQALPAYPHLNQMPSQPQSQPEPHPQDPRRPVPQQQQLQLGQQHHLRPSQQPGGVQQPVHQQQQPQQHQPGFVLQQQPSFGPQQQHQQHQQPGFGIQQQQQQPIFGQQAQHAQQAQQAQPKFGLQAQPGSMQQQDGLILPGRGLPNAVGSVNAASANAVTGPNRWGMQQAGSAATGRYAQPHKPTPAVKQSDAPASKPGVKQVETCVSVSSKLVVDLNSFSSKCFTA